MWIDRFETESLLNCKVPGMNVVVLKGTADVAPCTSAAIKNEYEQSGRRLRIVVDVKQPGNTDGYVLYVGVFSHAISAAVMHVHLASCAFVLAATCLSWLPCCWGPATIPPASSLLAF